MKRMLTILVLTVAVAGIAAAQMGPQPAGYSVFEGGESMLSVYVPGGWFAMEHEGGVAVANREHLLAMVGEDEPDLAPGDAVMQVAILPTLILAFMGVDPTSVEAITMGMFESMSENEEDLSDGEFEMIEIGDYSVGSIVFDVPEQGGTGLMFVGEPSEEALILGIGFAAVDALSANLEDMATVVATAEFTGSIEELMGGM